ncbi:MAG: methyltransferase domain-containing protein [Prolixibacteraceae bacterium]|nr:methyltransferase domain-containing protein [Prolixibacteraceae bacterium]
MNYIITKSHSQVELNLFEKIEGRFETLYSKLKSVDLEEVGLSPYNQRYLKEYLDNYIFFARFYSQVFIEGLRDLKKPLEEAVFIDYGGGSGFFSFLAKETGFKKVIYNDIYDVSVADAQKLSEALAIQIDHFIEGDIEAVVNELERSGIRPDLICSFEVVEHIYDLKKWFNSAYKIKGEFSLVFSSSANIRNPYISYKLKNGHRKAELVGTEKTPGSKERDAVLPFFKIRETIISENFPVLVENEVRRLAKLTRGYNKKDIIKSVDEFLKSGSSVIPIVHPTNTCDPFTGNWTENLIGQKWLKKIIAGIGFKEVSIQPGLYTYSNNKFAYLVKKLLNVLIRLFGKKGLIFSPVYILKAKKSN